MKTIIFPHNTQNTPLWGIQVLIEIGKVKKR